MPKDKLPKETSNWDYMFGQVMAKLESLAKAIDNNTNTTNKRMDEMHERTNADIKELKEKLEKIDDKVNAADSKITRNTVISSIVVSLIVAALVTFIKNDII
ncbi:MAG: hypothetical protein K0U41_00700 [Gammaproteobacteria bacterium]|nr:hypothetical protein [Gammaproteobacteria bacterium]